MPTMMIPMTTMTPTTGNVITRAQLKKLAAELQLVTKPLKTHHIAKLIPLTSVMFIRLTLCSDRLQQKTKHKYV